MNAINLADSRGMVATASKRTCRLAGDSGEKGIRRASAGRSGYTQVTKGALNEPSDDRSGEGRVGSGPIDA